MGTGEIYTHVSLKGVNKIENPLDLGKTQGILSTQCDFSNVVKHKMNQQESPSFEKTVRDIPGISQQEIDTIFSKFNLKRYTKNNFIGRDGETCRFTAYVMKGCVSNYRILENGKKSINHFAFEDWWVGDLDSFLNQKPSRTYWLTLEDTDLMAISKSDFDFIMLNIPPFERFFLKKTQSAFLKEMENSDKDKSETALERYIRMVKDYPQIIQRVPNYDIAAYIGIAPESLSRIRRQAMNALK